MTNSEIHNRKTARSDLENRQTPSRCQLFSKNLRVWRTFDMLGRVLARSQHRSACTSSCLREGLMDNQDSEIAHLKFVAFFCFLNSHKSAEVVFLRVWHVKIRVGMRSIGIDS